jgi:tRNA nucleotidyltransferase (CCA-adding enzyme)
MVRNGPPVSDEQASPQRLAQILASLEGIERIREAAGDVPAYLVGGAVRDLLLGDRRVDVDVVVEGDASDVAARLGGESIAHERFGTAKVRAGELVADLAAARSESYPHPGALPEVRPATLADDLARRDFTINAMAIPIQGEPRLIDPHGGREDLERGLLRVLHERSFVDDPTRALRAARYAARLAFDPEAETERLIRETDLGTVSEDRREAELYKLASEPRARRGFELLDEWGLVPLDEQRGDLIDLVADLLSEPPWSEVTQRPAAVLAAARGEVGQAARLASHEPSRPSEGVEMARRASGVELAIARALGAKWLDDYVRDWRHVGLEITGEDLLAAGVPEGPAVGRGLAAALAGKLDGEIHGRDEELAAALEAAREPEGPT